MNKSPQACHVFPAAGLAAMQPLGNGHCYIESSFLYSRTRRGYITRWPAVPSGAAQGPGRHTTQRARGEIFKLSLLSGYAQANLIVETKSCNSNLWVGSKE